jgi:hypothetical protein
MTRIVLAFVLALTFQAASADVLIIDEVRQAGRMERSQAGDMTHTAFISNMTWCYLPYCTPVQS